MAAKDVMCMNEEDGYQHEWKSTRTVHQDEFVLTKVMGLTNISKNALDCNPATGQVAFPASSMLVLLEPKTNDQKYMRNPTGKNISCLAFSDDGRLVALGESGVKPLVSLWSVKDLKELSKFIVDHSVGVKTIAIHPKYSYLVVIGIQDLNIGVWDYVRCNRLALTKWQTVPLSLTIPRSGTSVILCGHRKITLFNLDKVNSTSYETNVFEDKKAVLLGRQSEYTFIDITSGKGKHDKNVYSVTTCGYLCEIRLGDILIDKAIKVDSRAFCVRFALNHVFVGCCQGVVKICNPDSLTVAVAVSLDQLLGSEAFPRAAAKLYLDTTAIAVNEKESIVTCIYSNCSIYSWQINNFSDGFECSVLLPSLDEQMDDLELNSCVTESVCKANMFRSLMGCIEFSKDSRLFDTETLAARNGLRCHHDLMHMIKGGSAKHQHVTSFRFSPDGRDVICGNEAGEIKVYDAGTGVLRRVIEAHSAQVMCIELLYDGDYQLVCTGGRDRIIFILNAKADFSLVQVLCDHSAAITAISLVSHDGLLTLVSAAADNLILVRRATSGNSLKFTVTGQIVESRYNKALNVTGDYIITGDRNGNIKLFKADPIFNPKLSKTLKTFPKGNQNTSLPRPMCIDPTGSFIATAQNAGQIVVYHLPTGQPIACLPAQTDATTIKFTSCLRYMVSSTSNGCTMIWRIPERMTEFLVAKRNKSYQIEIAKEVSYEATFVSCVKVCKEMTVRESPRGCNKQSCSGPNANHNYDTDATPSIESLSFLRDGQDGDGESDGNSLYSTDSYISCSTCRESCSDTINWCRSSDSSIQTNSGTISFNFRDDDDICSRIVEDSQCQKLGIFKDKCLEEPSFVFGSNHTLQKVTENKTHSQEKSEACIKEKQDHTLLPVSCGSEKPIGALNNDETNEGTASVQSHIAKEAEAGDSDTRVITGSSMSIKQTVPAQTGKFSCILTEHNTVNTRRTGANSAMSEPVNKRDILEDIKDALKTNLEPGLYNTSQHPTAQRPGSLECQLGTLGKDNMADSNTVLSAMARQVWNLPITPWNLTAIPNSTSPTSMGSYRTACSPKLVNSVETCSPANSIFFSPSPCFSPEGDDRILSGHTKSDMDNTASSDLKDNIANGSPKDSITSVGLTDNIVDSGPHDKGANDGPTDYSVSHCPQDNIAHSNTFSMQCTHSPNASCGNHVTVNTPTAILPAPLSLRLPSPILVSTVWACPADMNVDDSVFSENDQRELQNKKLRRTLDDKETQNSHQCESAREFTDISTISNSQFNKAKSASRNEMPPEVVDTTHDYTDNMADNAAKEKCQAANSNETQAERLHPWSSKNGRQETLVSADIVDDETVYNYHSITRDESGKLRVVNNSKPNSPLSHYTHVDSPSNNHNPHLNPPKNVENVTVENCQFTKHSHACCAQDSSSVKCYSFVDSKSYSRNNDHIPNDSNSHSRKNCFTSEGGNSYPTHNCQNSMNGSSCPRNSYHASVNDISCPRNTCHTSINGSSCARNNCHIHLHQDVDAAPLVSSSPKALLQNYNIISGPESLDLSEQKLEEYFSELRQCLQLTNCQETVYKLACDAQDHELMELLELVLKKKPSALTETMNFPATPLEMIRYSLVKTGSNEEERVCELNYDSLKNKNQAMVKSTTPPMDREDTLKHFQIPKLKTFSDKDKIDPVDGRSFTQCFSRSLDGIECNHSTAKALINLFGHILANRRATKDHKSTAESSATVSEKVQVFDGQGEANRKPSREVKSLEPPRVQQKSEMQSQLANTIPTTLTAQQCLVNSTVYNNRHAKGNINVDNVKEAVIENGLISDLCHLKTPVTETAVSRGLGCPSSGRAYQANETPVTVRLTPRVGPDLGPPTRTQMSPERTKKVCHMSQKDAVASSQATEASIPQISCLGKGSCPSVDNQRGEVKESRLNKDSVCPGDRRYPAPIVELFRDQDEYLKKLKEVREKFEMSIQALSNERKSRLAEEERNQSK